MIKGLKKLMTGTAGLMVLVGVSGAGLWACTTAEGAYGPEAATPTTQSAVESVSEPVSVVAGDRPAMWRLGDEDTEIFLFGTFHLLPQGTEWSSSVLDAAMAKTSVTYFEADVTSPEAQQALQLGVQQYGLNPPGVTLSSVLGEERAARFGEVAGRYGLPLAQLEPLRPWLASLSVTLTAFQQAGFDPGAGVDMVLLEQVKAQGDEVRYLESGLDQIRALATLDADGNFAAFDDGLDQIDDLEEMLTRLLHAWRTGDVDALEADLVAQLRDVSPQAFEALITNRNANWVDQIKVLMAGDGNYFIAVGAAHLVGEESVVDMLEDQGFTLTRVQ